MATLNIAPNLARPDEFYEALLAMHGDLDSAQSQMVNARLILLLANHIGDPDVLFEAMRRARSDIGDAGRPAGRSIPHPARQGKRQ